MMNCPHCTSTNVVKNGHRNGKQSYLCRDCCR
ncbi:MAG: IS1 family transposase [Leptolyngbya sp. DLM2.Bin15]|nr:MAG: IS1 family transposase [Leptolyngbya sp. DLM2.Bin15]